MFIAPRKSPRSSQTPSATFSRPMSQAYARLGLRRALDLESGDGRADRLPRRLDGDRDRAPGDDPDGDDRRRLPRPARAAGRTFRGSLVTDPSAGEPGSVGRVSIDRVQRPSRGEAVFTRIVVGTDGSETAAEAVRQAVDLAKLAGATLSIVSAFSPIPARKVKTQQLDAPADVQYEIGPREDVNLVLDAAAADARKEGIEIQTHPVEGDPAEAILNVAEETKADLIVVGNRGMPGPRRFVLGSVPNNISHHAPCSVIIVRTT